jgi:tight adherence protein B
VIPLPFPFPANRLFAYGGIFLVIGGLGWVTYAILFGDTILTRYYRQYTAHLDRNLRLLFLTGSGTRIAGGQVVASLVLAIAGIFLDLPMWYLLIVLAAVMPTLYLHQKRQEHVKKIEAQIDSFILSFANALKTVPSPSAALGSLTPVLPMPTKLEIERVLKEMRVGSTIEQGILNMSSRLKSPNIDSALSAVLVGLQVGGNLPLVLENTAATIREMNRLDGVVKTKTSEARAQLWVLALFPFGIMLAFNSLEEGYFDPLQSSMVGYIVTTIATGLWMSALVTARKILKVDI